MLTPFPIHSLNNTDIIQALLDPMSSLRVFSGVRVTLSLVLCGFFVERCLSFCAFSFGHCDVSSSAIHRFWLPLWYLQAFLRYQIHSYLFRSWRRWNLQDSNMCSYWYRLHMLTTKWNKLFSLKGTTFVYVLSSDWWISGLTSKY
jgi:hypothetical protein